jgi:hypothetical protein
LSGSVSASRSLSRFLSLRAAMVSFVNEQVGQAGLGRGALPPEGSLTGNRTTSGSGGIDAGNRISMAAGPNNHPLEPGGYVNARRRRTEDLVP